MPPSDTDPLSFLIICTSSHATRHRRRACATTWLPAIRPFTNIAVLFAIGQPKNAAPCAPTLRLDHCLLLPVLDDYEHQPAKLAAALRWTVSHVTFDYVLCCHDDTFIIPARLANFHSAQHYVGAKLSRGYCHGGAGFLLDSHAANTIAAAMKQTTGPVDALVGTTLGNHDIYPTNANAFPIISKGRMGRNDTRITIHPAPPAAMRGFHNHFNR